jgi:hypothetical protein
VTVPLNCGATLAVKVTDCPKIDGLSEEAKVVVVVALVTTWLAVFDVLLAKFESPEYTALTLSELLTISVDVAKMAVPLLKAPVPNTVLPCMNVTISPSGGAPRLEVTCAVKVTTCPYADGFGEDERLVVVTVALRLEAVTSNRTIKNAATFMHISGLTFRVVDAK